MSVPATGMLPTGCRRARGDEHVLLVTDGPAIEVLRATAVGPFTVATAVVGAFAAAATIVIIALQVVSGASRRALLLVWEAATALTALEVLWLLVDGGGFGDRRTVAAMARLLLLVAGAVIEQRGTRRQLAVIAAMGLVTVALGSPAAGTPAALATALTLSLIGVLVVVGIGRLLGARREVGRSFALVLVAALAVPGVLLMVPEPPPTHIERIVVDEVALDLTVSPLEPGPNEVHVYAWQLTGDEVELVSATAQVVGAAGSATGAQRTLFEVTGNHRLSYELELPPGESWVVAVTAVTTDGHPRTATLELEAP